MPSLMQSLKDSKRRFTQRMKIATGRSLLPADDYFENYYSVYTALKKDLVELSVYCKNVLKNMKNWSVNNHKLSAHLHKSIEEAKGFENEVLKECCSDASDLKNVFQEESDKTLRVVSTVLNHRVIKQIDDFVKLGSEGVDSLYKQRKNIRLDYDSHLQRVEVYRKKKNDAQMNRFEAKADYDRLMLDQFETYLLSYFEEFVSLGNVILMECFAAIAVAQSFVVKAQFDGLSDVGNNIGEEYTSLVLTDLEDALEGVNNGSDIEKEFHPDLHVFTFTKDHAVPKYISFHEYTKNNKGEPPIIESISTGGDSISASRSVPSVYTEEEAEEYYTPEWSSEEDEYGYYVEDEPPFEVVAEYRFRSSEEGDLSFKKGDVITVTAVDDSGWWTGELNGRVGIFPANYVYRA